MELHISMFLIVFSIATQTTSASAIDSWAQQPPYIADSQTLSLTVQEGGAEGLSRYSPTASSRTPPRGGVLCVGAAWPGRRRVRLLSSGPGARSCGPRRPGPAAPLGDEPSTSEGQEVRRRYSRPPWHSVSQSCSLRRLSSHSLSFSLGRSCR